MGTILERIATAQRMREEKRRWESIARMASAWLPLAALIAPSQVTNDLAMHGDPGHC